jgi:non-ribosomal peptide synthetase component F
VLIPPGWSAQRLETVLKDAEVDAVVCDDDVEAAAVRLDMAVRCVLPLRPAESRQDERRESEWILPTSGTNGPPKLVLHTLRTLTAPSRDRVR